MGTGRTDEFRKGCGADRIDQRAFTQTGRRWSWCRDVFIEQMNHGASRRGCSTCSGSCTCALERTAWAQKPRTARGVGVLKISYWFWRAFARQKQPVL